MAKRQRKKNDVPKDIIFDMEKNSKTFLPDGLSQIKEEAMPKNWYDIKIILIFPDYQETKIFYKKLIRIAVRPSVCPEGCFFSDQISGACFSRYSSASTFHNPFVLATNFASSAYMAFVLPNSSKSAIAVKGRFL